MAENMTFESSNYSNREVILNHYANVNKYFCIL